jgi:translation initiation factor 4G
VRPQKKSNAIKITDAQGNAVDFKKPSPTPPATSQGPVIVSTPNAPTPPPRTASNNHNRTESKTTKSSEETKNAFAEQVKRQVEENKRKEQEAAASKAKEESDKTAEKVKAEEDAQNQVKEAAAEAEKAAAQAAADKKAEEDAEAAKQAQEAKDAEPTEKEETEDERLEREIAEMEAREREEEERERAYQEKKAKEKAERDAKEAEKAKNIDEELKRQEREAEAREEARERERAGESKKSEPDEDAKAMYASLKKAPLGPAASVSGTETPTSEKDAEEPAEPTSAPAQRAGAQKPKPAHLKLETNKPVERAEPTPGMQALKSARFLEIKEEARYPDGFKSPNPALNDAGARKGRAYDKSFLLQFQTVFKEKPSVDWDQKVKDTLGPGDDPGSARPGSARTPSGMGGRSGSRGGNMGQFGAMGSFGGGQVRNASGTTSEQRFAMSQGMGIPPQGRPGAPPGRVPSQLGMGQPGSGMSRTNSLQTMGSIGGPNAPRQPSARGGKGGSHRGDRQQSRRHDQEAANKMPLTAHMEITPLEKSQSGWKPMSLVQQPMASGPDPSGMMAPDMVQRKVKAALNKMTPEKFDKISDQILEIAGQSKHETDGRTLRQVIQLTFEKACDEAHWAGMYAKFCQKMLTTMSPEIRDETIKDKQGNPVVGGALFRKYLLNRCQEEFERGWQVNLPDKPDGENQEAVLLSDEYYIAAAAKRRGLGLIQFIGQLYKLRMLTLRIMHECVMRLLNFEGDPDESAVENLTTLLRAVGATMDEEENGRPLMDTYFSRINDVIMKSDKLPSRPKFMVMDLVDLRRVGWKGKDDSKGPKTIQQIHEEAQAAIAKADAERNKSGPRGGPGRPQAGRGDARNFSGNNMPPPVDYARTTVGVDDLRRLQSRGSQRTTGGSLGPGGGLSSLGPRTGSRRGAGGLGPGSAGTSRTNTPPVGDKKDEPSTAQNAFR